MARQCLGHSRRVQSRGRYRDLGVLRDSAKGTVARHNREVCTESLRCGATVTMRQCHGYCRRALSPTGSGSLETLLSQFLQHIFTKPDIGSSDATAKKD
ncbi:hypothetical protein L6452_43484 [Arctium lappa]|uniref:Uncharacterized protein n=1 Tax=Arctium lappa TaxID=4217 RepID=A0ACB8XD24_ARCLA|nr:hypothetical protein L6452_43484 [Arctium lappa]